MKYRHRFRLRSSIAQADDFRRRNTSMPGVTPLPMNLQLHHTPDVLGVGNKMGYSMGVDPHTIHPAASIEGISPTGFTGRQIHSLFAEWVHRQVFNALDNQITELVDEITLRPCSHRLWFLVDMGMRAGLPILFAFRASKTRSLLQ